MKPNTRHALLAASAALFVVVAFPVSAETDVAGVTAAVNPDASTIDRAGKTRLISLGDPVIRNHRIETSGAGLVQILLADGTSFTVGPNSSVVIDSFVYDPEKNTAALAATMSKGALRFIGGKASKASGNVTIKTPIGTAGIRGAVVDINLSGQTPDGQPLPPHMTLVYGKEVQLTGNGAPQRLFKQGFSIVAGDGQPRVQRTPPQWVSGLQQVLAGRPGQSGGASDAPTEQTVASSTVAESNSAQLPSDNAIPVPTPRPIVTTPVEDVASASQRDVGTRPQVPGSDGNDSGGADTEIAVSVLSPTGVGSGGGAIGGSSSVRLNQSRGTLTRNADNTLTGSDGAGNDFTLPALSSATALTKRSVTAEVNGTAVNGTAYTGSGDFFTYLLKAQSADPKAFYVIGGTPADAQGTLSSGKIMSYVLKPDLLAALMNDDDQTIPFTGSFIGSADAVVSDLLVSGVSTPSGGVVGRALQASLAISGTGPTQTSAINVMSGVFKPVSGGGYGMTGSTAGSSRSDAEVEAGHHQGLNASIGSTAGEDHFLGADGEYLVIASGSMDTREFGEAAPQFDGYEQVHVASRDDSISIDGQKRFSDETFGFTSGIVEEFGGERLFTGRVTITPNADSGTFQGRLTSNGGDEYADFYSEKANSSYLSDQLIAATNQEQGSYMVSSAAVPAKIFDGGASSQICNACDFMTWGWWGRNSVGEVGYKVHLANWIIGKQPENSALPTSGTATYSGNAVGTVVNGSAQYIATGTMTSTMDFGARSGTVSVSNYDSKSFSAGVNFGSGAATFSGNVTSGVASGSVTGAFAANGTDPVKGIMGNFTVTDGSWESTGIFAGSTTGVVP
ncbi:MAG: FecR domain-containing protein [Alphaproteobacteria bacterium]|nr:FecR domain-containing protein [Alphaproteobacteria bacterium]MBU0830807.1 FecR domain-containing protein [Alphaproteobacteria bacterium]MBU1765208.1 FecR domain-containing protein [Alphaproteobacteria bacterium]